MPGSTDVYGKRDLVAVQIAARFNGLWYGFRTNTSSAERTALGQVPGLVGGEYKSGMLVGINAPRPAKFTKTDATLGYDGSYADYRQFDALLAAGWVMRKAIRTRTAGNGKFSTPVYVDWKIPDLTDPQNPGTITVKYALAKADWSVAAIGADATALGITPITDRSADDFVWGSGRGQARQFKPSRASKLLADGSRVSTFISTTAENNLPAGWELQTK